MPHLARWFEYEGYVYTVVNPSPVESLPGIATDDPERNLTCKDMRNSQWALDKVPEMAYMLKSFTTESAFMGRLNCHAKALPIVKTDSGYALRQDIREYWYRLEHMFTSITSILMESQCRNPEASMPFDAHWSPPHVCGYLQAHKSAYAARVAALRSRDACVLLLARCTMAIALCSRSEDNRVANNPPDWIRLLDGRVPAAWIDILRNSVVSNLSRRLRTGAFIDPVKSTAWVQHVPCMIRANLPVYICWNAPVDDIVAKYPFLADFAPPSVHIPSVTENDPRCLRFRWSSYSEPKSTTPIAMQDVPGLETSPPRTSRLEQANLKDRNLGVNDPSDPRSSSNVWGTHVEDPRPCGPGQRPGETHNDFLARRERLRAIWTERASAGELAAYKQRLQRASSFARPNPPTKVYVWKLIGDDNGDLSEDWHQLEVRVPIAFRAVGEMWGLYLDCHKVYDAGADEWDICPALSEDNDEDLYRNEVDDQCSDILESQPLSEGAMAESAFYDTELRLFYEDEEQHFYRPTLEAFRSLSRFRYGIIPEVIEAADIAYNKYDNMQIRRFFGLVNEDMDEDTIQMVKPAGAFVAHMLENPENAWAPGVIWDLEASCSHYLLAALPTASIVLFDRDINEAQYLEVQYKNDAKDTCWSLFVDEMTALELCRRRSIVGLKEAVKFLTQRGTRITLAWQPQLRERMGLRLTAPRPVYLGWRRLDFKPDGWDYMEYERQARELLFQPRGRAAILRGGIVWRLAVELLGEDGLRRIEGGPSSDIWEHGRKIPARHGDPWYEDSPSSYELDLICGVYKIYTNRSGKQTADVSWWPKADAWERGTLNMGYWTPFAEVWFQLRLDRVRSHEAHPKTASVWTDDLKAAPGAKRLKRAVLTASKTFLKLYGGRIFERT